MLWVVRNPTVLTGVVWRRSSSSIITRTTTSKTTTVAKSNARGCGRRWQSNTNNTTTNQQSAESSTTTATASGSSPTSTSFTGTSSLPPNPTPQQVETYLQQANAHMEKYHEARELLRQGKLPSKNQHLGPPAQQGTIQLVVVGLFLVAFAATPFLGKRIAHDEEFKQKWIPAWYDFTAQKPERPWTRQELHEQMVAVEHELRQRAIQGDFTAEKLEQMQRHFNEQHSPPASSLSVSSSSTNEKTASASSSMNPLFGAVPAAGGASHPRGWDKIHPGLDADENLNED